MTNAPDQKESTVLVTGAGSQTARCMADLTGEFSHLQMLFLTRDQLDISARHSAEEILDRLRPGYVINCAAYTAVDKAESEAEMAFMVNSEGPGILADACEKRDITLVHFSTDYVYHNSLRRPLVETDPTEPRSVYAKSKLSGEQRVAAAGGKSIILRTSWLYSEYGHNFVKTMLDLAQTRDTLDVVADQEGSPTYAHDLARATLDIITQIHQDAEFTGWGIYNYANLGQTTWCDYAREIFAVTGRSVQVNPVPTSGYPTPAERPPYSVMNMSKFRNTFGLGIRHWKDALWECLEAISIRT